MMQVDEVNLTELEGAILSEIQHRGHDTAFQVRRAFQTSPSIEWSGSAGAVYPAIKRLRSQGYIQGEPTNDGRATVRLSLTDTGQATLMIWACDARRSTSVGLDPFRLRSGIWRLLSPDRKRLTLSMAAKAIEANVAYLQQYLPSLDKVEAARVELSLRIQHVRLEWISEQLGIADQPAIEAR